MRLTALAMIAVLRGSQGLTRTVLRAAASTGATQKRVLVPIADGSEEIETACITDTLVRAGADVTVASIEATTLTFRVGGTRMSRAWPRRRLHTAAATATTRRPPPPRRCHRRLP